jgi:hypothetical protein
MGSKAPSSTSAPPAARAEEDHLALKDGQRLHRLEKILAQHAARLRTMLSSQPPKRSG